MQNADTVLEVLRGRDTRSSTCWRAGCGESRTPGSGRGRTETDPHPGGTAPCGLLHPLRLSIAKSGRPQGGHDLADGEDLSGVAILRRL